MTENLYLGNPYLAEAEGRVIAHTPEGGVVLDRTIFFPADGGQPGDSGRIDWANGNLTVATGVKAAHGHIVLVPAGPQGLPKVGTRVRQRLDWERRHRHMRMHTALHLLSVVIPLPVNGGAIGEACSRLDFKMLEPPQDRATLEAHLNMLVDRDLEVHEHWITEAELEADPDLIKTMSIRPHQGAGQVRLIRIGQGERQVDLQACGGTHVARSSEVGRLRLGKIERKGHHNHRVYLHFAE